MGIKMENSEQKKKILRLLKLFLGVVFIFLFLLNVKLLRQVREASEVLNQTRNLKYEDTDSSLKSPDKLDYVNFVAMTDVDRPMVRSKNEIIARLDELSKENKDIDEISQNLALYPENLLEALANNPEMADFVKGYPDAGQDVNVDLASFEKAQVYPLFLQWDPRWGYATYGDGGNIGLAGCGPTCLSMTLYYLTEDETITPDTIAAYSMANGYYVQGTGTSWALMEEIPRLYGIETRRLKLNEQSMKAELDQGRILICAMRKGDFTLEGHFIVIYGYDKKGFKVNDPNCVARSRKIWPYAAIEHQIKCLWTYAG